MKKAYVIAGLFLLAGLSFAVYSQVLKPQLDNRMVTAVVPTTIDRPDILLSFTYPSGEAGYALVEPPVAEESDIKAVFLLMETERYIKHQGKEDEEDAPPVISVMVFDNQADETEGGRITRMQNWAEKNSALTGFDNLSTESEVVEIDGARAIHYQTEGKYKKDMYLVSHRGNMYLFVGQSESDDDKMQQTYQDLIGSVLFY